MKRKCMKDGGQAKTLQEQLAQIKKKVGYANGGAVIGDDEQQRLLQPPVLDDQVAGFLSSVPAVRTPTPSLGPNLAQYASQPGTGQSLGYLGAPTAQSVGQRRAGAPSSGFLPGAVDQGQEQISKIQGMSGLSSRQKAAALSDVAGRLDDYGIKTDIGGALGSAAGGLSQRQKLALEQAQFGSNLNADRVAARGGIGAPLSPAGAQEDQSAYDPLTMPRGRQRRQRGFQDGGRVFKQGTTFSDRPLTPEPGSYPRAMPPAVTQGSRDKQVRFQAPRPVQPAVAASSYAPQGAYLGITGVADAIRDRKWKNAEAANYADGGMVKFAGKGGPRGDKIPVKVAGAEINVSNGENAVILPAKTAANRAAVQAINGIIQATNDGRKPSAGIEDGGKYQAGAYPYDGKRPPTAQELYGEISPGRNCCRFDPGNVGARQRLSRHQDLLAAECRPAARTRETSRKAGQSQTSRRPYRRSTSSPNRRMTSARPCARCNRQQAALVRSLQTQPRRSKKGFRTRTFRRARPANRPLLPWRQVQCKRAPSTALRQRSKESHRACGRRSDQRCTQIPAQPRATA
jgi:hypothetical protein